MDISGTTKLIGLLADPIAQVRTPAVMNPMLAERGANMIVVPLHVSAGDLDAVWAGLRLAKSFAGFLATVPHKSNVPALCDHVEPSARQVGAANTIRRRPDGSLSCATFDGIGFVAGLRAEGHAPDGKRVLLAGAGGAASAVAYALADAGVSELAITNRTEAKAGALATSVAKEYPAVNAYSAPPDPTGFDLVVNGTSLGMAEGDPAPVMFDRLSANMIIADVIMVPEITPLLAAGRAAGATIHGGIHMLKGQLTSIVDFLTTDLDH